MKFEDMRPIGRDEAEQELASEVPQRISRALVRLSLHNPDRAWLEDIIAVHLESQDPWVRAVAATCAGHVARIHRTLDVDRLVPLIEGLGAEPATLGRMQDALEDIETFVPQQGRGPTDLGSA